MYSNSSIWGFTFGYTDSQTLLPAGLLFHSLNNSALCLSQDALIVPGNDDHKDPQSHHHASQRGRWSKSLYHQCGDAGTLAVNSETSQEEQKRRGCRWDLEPSLPTTHGARQTHHLTPVDLILLICKLTGLDQGTLGSFSNWGEKCRAQFDSSRMINETPVDPSMIVFSSLRT